MNLNLYFFLLLLSVIIASFSQVLLKISSGKSHPSLVREYFNPYVIAGYGMLLISTIFTILAFHGMDYKNGPLIESSGYIFIMLLSRWILKEKITRKKLIGNGLILLGIVVYYL